jgi:cation diffusion facilitator CzcD-associated flavoprotein CzcO
VGEAEHFDVLVVGAGLSGVGAAWHLQRFAPHRRYVMLEGRESIGGTWDLFRYPGIRSDSDMYTLGYSFRPWLGKKSIADGESIREYVRETAREHGIDRKIRFGHRVVRAEWSSAEARWSVQVEVGPERMPARFTCGFLYTCTGYYDYERGYTPEWPGMELFRGRIVHPQHWPEELDYTGMRVVVIGSGATAVTLVPELAKKAAHVTMLQRSPSYVMSLPGEDPIARWLDGKLPRSVAYDVTRFKNVALALAFFKLCRRYPRPMKKLLVAGVRKALGRHVDVDTHFTPRYDPWDQRLCFVPDGDLFRALRGGNAEVVTGEIETFTAEGIRLRSGEALACDLVVTATGLRLLIAGGMQLVVDGRPVRPADTLNYKGTMLSDVPNFAIALGYTNASWTLKCDLVCEYVCRLIGHLDRTGSDFCVPRVPAAGQTPQPILDFSSGYVLRALAELPKQGSRAPWRLYQNYFLDILNLRLGRIDDPDLELGRAGAADRPEPLRDVAASASPATP